jgi:hypothetical protein
MLKLVNPIRALQLGASACTSLATGQPAQETFDPAELMGAAALLWQMAETLKALAKGQLRRSEERRL